MVVVVGGCGGCGVDVDMDVDVVDVEVSFSLLLWLFFFFPFFSFFVSCGMSGRFVVVVVWVDFVVTVGSVVAGGADNSWIEKERERRRERKNKK